MAVKRDQNGKFAKGNEGGGRPRQPEAFKTAVKKNALPALMTVIEIMNDRDAAKADRIKAANIIIERAYGKAPQSVDLTSVTVSADTQAILDRLLKEEAEPL